MGVQAVGRNSIKIRIRMCVVVGVISVWWDVKRLEIAWEFLSGEKWRIL